VLVIDKNGRITPHTYLLSWPLVELYTASKNFRQNKTPTSLFFFLFFDLVDQLINSVFGFRGLDIN
jgi:hypothetical protein